MSHPDENWPAAAAHEAAAALPPERDDDPPSLRQDILDELSDHLACAFRRELLRTSGDGTRAEANVRQRFGDPARVARKLWFDAMRSRLMLQKVLVGTCAAVVATCIILGLLLWQTVTGLAVANTALVRRVEETNAALIEQSRRQNTVLIEQLRKLREAPASIDPEWNPVVIRLRSGSKNGPPAARMQVSLDPAAEGELTSEATSGPDGLVDFGLLRPGKYTLSVNPPWSGRHYQSIEVRPGRAIDLTVACPSAPPVTVAVSWKIDWPAGLDALERPDDLWCMAVVEGSLQRSFDGDDWSSSDFRVMAFHPDGRTIQLSRDLAEADPEFLRTSSFAQLFVTSYLGPEPAEPGRVFAGGQYRVTELGLSRWDGSGSPLRLLGSDTVVRFGAPGAFFRGADVMAGTLGNALQLSTEGRNWHVPPDRQAEFELAVPEGFVRWVERNAAPPSDSRRRPRGISSDEAAELRKLFLQAERVEPVEAHRPARDTTILVVESERVALRIECVSDSTDRKPLADVAIQLDRAGFGTPFDATLVKPTDARGWALFDLLPGSYHNYLTTPWGETSHARNVFEVSSHEGWYHRLGPRIETFVCPAAPPPTSAARFDVSWPASAKSKSDLWLLLELAGESIRTVGNRQWRDTDVHLTAIHPSGRVVAWARRPEVRYIPYRDLAGIPDLLSKYTARDRPEPFFRAGNYRCLGVGIARWDGTGDPQALLTGLRDGRYVSKTRGDFFHVLRHVAPMKADANPPQPKLHTESQNLLTLSYEVPPPLVDAALKRWDSVPAVTARSTAMK